MYIRDDLIGYILEPAVADNDLLIIDTVSTFSQDFPKISGVVWRHIHEVEFTVKDQRLDTVPVQSLLGGSELFKHY